MFSFQSNRYKKLAPLLSCFCNGLWKNLSSVSRDPGTAIPESRLTGLGPVSRSSRLLPGSLSRFVFHSRWEFQNFWKLTVRFSAKETKRTSLEVRTHPTFLETSISKYDTGPVNLPGLSRNGPLARLSCNREVDFYGRDPGKQSWPTADLRASRFRRI